jgi:hypothetical protein
VGVWKAQLVQRAWRLKEPRLTAVALAAAAAAAAAAATRPSLLSQKGCDRACASLEREHIELAEGLA